MRRAMHPYECRLAKSFGRANKAAILPLHDLLELVIRRTQGVAVLRMRLCVPIEQVNPCLLLTRIWSRKPGHRSPKDLGGTGHSDRFLGVRGLGCQDPVEFQ